MEDGENVVEFTYASPYVKYMLIGGGVAVVALCALGFVLTKKKFIEGVAPVIAWAGISLAVVVVAVFMVYPTGACVAKLVELLKGVIGK